MPLEAEDSPLLSPTFVKEEGEKSVVRAADPKVFWLVVLECSIFLLSWDRVNIYAVFLARHKERKVAFWGSQDLSLKCCGFFFSPFDGKNNLA